MDKIKTGKTLWVLLGLLVLGLPLRWLIAAAVSVAVHEMCHYFAVCMCGGQVYSLHISASGLKMRTSSLSAGRELVCALAGPAGSFLLFLMCIRMPRLALCALAHCVYNLIPLYPMDGGRAVKNLFILLFPCWGTRVFMWFERVLGVVFVLACLWCCFVQKVGILPLVLAGIVLAKSELTK